MADDEVEDELTRVLVGWWACPVNDTFELFYGINPDPANLPSTDCQGFELAAGFA